MLLLLSNEHEEGGGLIFCFCSDFLGSKYSFWLLVHFFLCFAIVMGQTSIHPRHHRHYHDLLVLNRPDSRAPPPTASTAATTA